MTDDSTPHERYQAWLRDFRGSLSPRRKALRAPGHKLTVEWSGETGDERSSTGTCPCGWMESGSTQEVVREEYRRHIERVLGAT